MSVADNQQHNPYRSPEVASPASELTKRQRAVLEFYYAHRERPMRTWRLVIRLLPSWLLCSVVFFVVLVLAAGAARTGSDLPRYVFCLLFGMFCSVVARDLGYALRGARFWPVLSDVMDWEKVRAKLGRDDP